MTKTERAWAGLSAPELRRGDLEALLAGEAAFVRVPGFLPAKRCAELLDRFVGSKPPVYREDVYGTTRLLRLGINYSVLTGSPQAYFSAVPALERSLRSFYAGGEDPLLKLAEALSRAGLSRAELEDSGGRYLTDELLGIAPPSSVALHADTAVPGTAPARFPSLVSWNVYLSSAQRGGALRVYRRAYTEAALAAREGVFGFSRKVVEDAPVVEAEPLTGDLILFLPTNFHEVTKLSGSRCRLAAHAFIGVDQPRGKFGFWV